MSDLFLAFDFEVTGDSIRTFDYLLPEPSQKNERLTLTNFLLQQNRISFWLDLKIVSYWSWT